MVWSSIYASLTYVIVFVIAASILRNALDLDGGEAIAFTIGIMVIAIVGDIIRKGVERRGKTNQSEQAQIQTALKQLTKRVDEMQEYITDMYIQQHDQRANAKTDKS